MAGFLFQLNGGSRESVSAAATALSFVPEDNAGLVCEDPFCCACVRVDSPVLWASAFDPKTNVRVFLGGRIALEEDEWQQAESDTELQGGLACRHLLRQYLRAGETALTSFNGAAGVVVWDPRKQLVLTSTDRLGFFPVYGCRTEDCTNTIVATHPDVLADIAGISNAFDLDTLAESLALGTALHPYTYYKDIRQLDPGSLYVWDLSAGKTRHRQYWKPGFPADDAGTFNEHAANLEQALRAAVRRRTHPRLAPIAVSLSGGYDSRLIPFASQNADDLIAFTFYDEPNQELEIARKLAEKAGIRFEPLQREPEYYPSSAEFGAHVSAGMWSVVDFHHLGFQQRIMSWKPNSLLTGCYADWLFKGLALDTTYRKLFGRNLPLQKLRPVRRPGVALFHPSELAEHWQSRTEKRLAERFADTSANPVSTADHHLLEDRRMRPINREETAGTRLTMWRVCPFDVLLADSDLLDCWVRLPAHWKADGQVWKKAVSRICRRARSIPNANTGVRDDLGPIWRALGFLAQSAKRKLKARLGGPKPAGLATTGSWPHWPYLLTHSQKVRELWNDPQPEEVEFFSEFLGFSPWERSIEDWARKDFMMFSRLLTLRLWLRNHRPR